MVKFNGKVQDYENAGGDSNFKSKVATILGIQDSQILIVSVAAPSITVTYDMSSLESSDAQAKTLEEIRSLQIEKMATGDYDIGNFLVLDIDLISDQGVKQNIVSGGIVTASGYYWKRLTRTPANRDIVDPGTINQRRRVLQTEETFGNLDTFIIFELLGLSLILIIIYPQVCKGLCVICQDLKYNIPLASHYCIKVSGVQIDHASPYEVICKVQ